MHLTHRWQPNPACSSTIAKTLTTAIAMIVAMASSPFLWAQPSSTKQESNRPLRIEVARDTWLSSVPQELQGSNGGAARMKLKSYQEMSLIDFDPQPLRGRTIKSAKLFMRSSSEATLLRVSLSTVAAPWTEGEGSNYASVPGASTFQHRSHPDTPWSYPGSDFCSVILGQGNTIWSSTDASQRDQDGWLSVDVDPRIIAHRIAEISYGTLLFDDTGSEWKREGEDFTSFPFPNRYIYSREQGKRHAPYLEIELGDEDLQAPEAPTDLLSKSENLPAGQVWLSWLTPADKGNAGTVGFEININSTAAPRYLIPLAKRPGERVSMLLDALPPTNRLNESLESESKIEIIAIDAAGNRSEPLQGTFTRSKYEFRNLLSKEPVRLPSKSPDLLLGESRVSILDELDKVNPSNGETIPKQTAEYWNANHLWNSTDRTIRLSGARKEILSFQIALSLPVKDFTPTLSFEDSNVASPARFGVYHNIMTDAGLMPDPIVPLTTPWSLSDPKLKFASIHVEFQIASSISAGKHSGKLRLQSAAGDIDLPIELTVWNFSIPDRLSFIPEMNSYGLPTKEIDYYQLAHEHRTVLNRLPYSHRGTVADGCAPKWNGSDFDWTQWDRRFGPLLDGTAFIQQARSGVPIECFYLPLFENWPVAIEPHYNGGYWADQSMSPEYRSEFVLASQKIAEHFREKGWNDTLFHFYLNGKNNFKENGWSRSTSPWILDEPSHFQDFVALHWFGKAFHEGAGKVRGTNSLLFRTDISRPQWQRDLLDGEIQYNVVGSAFRDYRRIVNERKLRNRELVIEYGTSNRLDQSNLQANVWCLDSWSLGADGVLPWQTIGTDASWKQGDELSLIYPLWYSTPVPSVRLKAYRRGQQDVEYMNILAATTGHPTWAVGRMVREVLAKNAPEGLGRKEGTGASGEDAGRITYGNMLPQELDSLRRSAASYLNYGQVSMPIPVTVRGLPQ